MENVTEGGDARRTRIIRPEDKIMQQMEEPNTKGIRGRRRVLYPVRVAPASTGPNRSVAVQPAPPTATTTPPKNTIVIRTSSQSRGRSASPASPSPVRPNRTSALRQNSSHTLKGKTASPESAMTPQVRLRPNNKSPRISSAPCSPRQLPQADESSAGANQIKRRSLEVTCKVGSYQRTSPPKSESVNLPIDPLHPPLATLGKQGTFTKEKSSTPSEPTKEEEPAVKVPPKVPPKPKLPLAKPALPKKPARFNNGPSPLSSPRSKGSPALSRRSVSSASIGSDSTVATSCSGVDEAASATPPQKRTPPKKVVASKISQLWKQVEESRNKEKMALPDARKWISRGDSAKPLTEDKSVGPGVNSPVVPPSETGQQRPMVSSGTFEKISSLTNTPLPVISDKKSPPSRLPFRLPRFGRSNSSSASTTPITPTLPTPPSPGFESGQDAEDKRKFRVTAL